MFWNIKLTVGVLFLALDPLQVDSKLTPVASIPETSIMTSSPETTPSSTSPDIRPSSTSPNTRPPSTTHTLSLSPRPIATVVKGQPLILTINIMSNTTSSWVLQWTNNRTSDHSLGSVTSSSVEMCQEGRNVSQACQINQTSVQFAVGHPRHEETIYCAVILGLLEPQSIFDSTKVYVIEPVESVTLTSLSGDIITDRLIVKEGEDIVLHCEASPSRPSATISWIKDNEDISSSAENVSVEYVGDDMFRTHSNLTITAQRSSNLLTSSIRCNAVNNGSNVNSNLLQLIVLGLPAKPAAISVKYINDKDVELIWSIEQGSVFRVNFNIIVLPNTGGVTVSNYERQTEGTQYGHDPAEVLFSSRIIGLQVNRAYNVSVAAYNDIGWSASTYVYIAIASDADGIEYYHVGLGLIIVASLILLLILGAVLVIRLKGNVQLPVSCRSRQNKEPEPLYEDLESIRNSDAPVIEKRLRKARRDKGELHTSTGLVSGVYNSIASNLDGVMKKENTVHSGTSGNIYDDIPGASALFTSSGSGSGEAAGEGKVTLNPPKTEPETELPKKKPRPPTLKKPTGWKKTAPPPDDVNKASTTEDIVTTTITEVDENDGKQEIMDDKPAADVATPCEYMDMRVPDRPPEAEYIEVRKLKDAPAETS